MHKWNVSVQEATEIQREMQRRVIHEPLPSFIRTVAGADISFSRLSDIFHACVVVFSYPELVQIERSFATARVTFPYVPGYLSFREVPTIAEAYKALKKKPDVLVMDGHGIAHPRRLGVASHLGIIIDIPTIGVAKSLLYGTGSMPADDAGSVSYLKDPKTKERIGAYLRTKKSSYPVIVSNGHRADLPTSLDLIRSVVRGYRIPEPTRQAHILVNQYRTGDIKK